MPLLRNGEISDSDLWLMTNDDTELPDNLEHVLVTLTRYLELQRNQGVLPAGVIVAPADDVQLLAPYVEQLHLIAIDFPTYTDGRGYSHARLLRKRMNYVGELRAMGDVRADSILFMARAGIDTFDFAELPDTRLLTELTTRYQKNYQPSYPLPRV